MKDMLRTTIAAAAVVCAPAAFAQDDPFYEGKTLNLIVGYSTGGSSDLACRVFANHLGKHIEGNPTIVVRNMPGASGLNAINFVGEAARNDGTTAICGTISILARLLDFDALNVDLSEFSFLMGVADSQVFFIRSDVEPGIEEPADLFEAEGIVYGGFAVDSSKDLAGRAYLDLLGLDYKYVTGIGSDSDGRAAIQQNFVNTWMEGLASYVAITGPTLTETGETVALFQSGLLDDEGELTVRDEALPDVPTFLEFYAEHVGGTPEGTDWEIVNVINGTYAASQRAIGLPPNAPQEAVDALSAAVGPLLEDEEFWAEARQILGADVKIFGGERVQNAYTNAMQASEEVREAMHEKIASGQSETR